MTATPTAPHPAIVALPPRAVKASEWEPTDDVDVDPVLTTDEARELIGALQAAVDQVEGTESG